MDAIRRILLTIEGGDEPYQRFIEKDEVYNVVLLADAGLLKAHYREVPGRGIVGATVERLTWAGHDFLDSIRDNALWEKAKATVMKPDASWTFPLLTDFLHGEAKARIAPAA
jgi:hypothetical protein